MRLFSGILLVGLCLRAISPAAAQAWEEYDYENLEFRGIGLEVGWVSPTRVSNALLLGVRADLGYLGPNVRILPSLTYWSSQLRRVELDRLAEQIRDVCLNQFESARCPLLDLGEVRLSDLALNLDGIYEFPNTPFIFFPYLGAGGSLHFLNSRGELINGTFIEDFLDSLAPGLNMIGGLRIPVTPSLEVIGEARYMLASEIRYGSLTAGASWVFPTRTGPPAQRRTR